MPNVTLAKSTDSYMNLQGSPIGRAWQKFQHDHKGQPCELVIVHDEIQVALGKVQIRRKRTSARGHNGLRSIDRAVGNEYTKIAVGIGKPAGDVADYVLSKFDRAQLEVLETITVPRVMEIVEEMAQGKHLQAK